MLDCANIYALLLCGTFANLKSDLRDLKSQWWRPAWAPADIHLAHVPTIFSEHLRPHYRTDLTLNLHTWTGTRVLAEAVQQTLSETPCELEIASLRIAEFEGAVMKTRMTADVKISHGAMDK